MRTDRGTKLLLVLVAGGLWMNAFLHGASKVDAQAPNIPDTIKAHKFEIDNKDGKPEAILDASTDHGVKVRGLMISDADGNPMATLSEFNGAPGIYLYDMNGKISTLLLSTDNGGDLTVSDKNGNTRTEIGNTKDGPFIYLDDTNGSPRAEIKVFKDKPQFIFYDKNGAALPVKP